MMEYDETIKQARRRGPLLRVYASKKKKYQAVLTNDSLFLYSGKTYQKYRKEIAIPLKGENIRMQVETDHNSKPKFSLNLITDEEGIEMIKTYRVSLIFLEIRNISFVISTITNPICTKLTCFK